MFIIPVSDCIQTLRSNARKFCFNSHEAFKIHSLVKKHTKCKKQNILYILSYFKLVNSLILFIKV